MRRFDIYQAEHEWGGCKDARPWLIVEVRPGDVFGCFPFASECYAGSCFPVPQSHPDFPATGLTKSCYIHDSHIIEVPRSSLRYKRGELTGALLADFQDFAGV